MSRIKQGLNKTSQQKLKKASKALADFPIIENKEEFAEQFENLLINDVRSIKGCSERAITDYYVDALFSQLHKAEVIDEAFFNAVKMDARSRLAHHYTNKTFDNNIDIYFNDVKREYIMCPQNESDDLEFVPENRDVFIKNNLKLVINCAKRYQNLGLPFEDLIQIGNEGLLVAFNKFDAERGNLRIAINKLIDESELETFTHEDAVKIIKAGFSYGDDLELTLSKIPEEGIASKDEFHEWVKKNVKTAVFASVAFQWIRAYIILELNRIGKIIRVPKTTKKESETTGDADIDEYLNAEDDSVQIINLDSVNPYTDDCYHDNELAEVTREEFIIEDEAIENMEKQDMFKGMIEKALCKLAATDRRIIKKKFGIGLPYSLSINEIAESENLSSNKVKYSITSSLKIIGNSFTDKEKMAIMDLL